MANSRLGFYFYWFTLPRALTHSRSVASSLSLAEFKQELSYLVKPFRGKKSLSVSPAIKEYRSFHGQFARCVFFKDRV